MRIFVSLAAADSFEFTIPAKFKNLLRLTDKQKDNTVTNVENDLSFVNTQEVVTVEHIEVKGNKITVWPAMELLDEPMSKIKLQMEKAFESWATKAFKSQSSSSSKQTIVLRPTTGPGMNYADFEDRFLYGDPKDIAKNLSKYFSLPIKAADQFDDGNSFAGCWLELVSAGKVRTVALVVKDASISDTVKFSGAKNIIMFEVGNKSQLYSGKPVVDGKAHTANRVDPLMYILKNSV